MKAALHATCALLIAIAVVAGSGCGQNALPGPDAGCTPLPDLAIWWEAGPPVDIARGPGTGDPCTRDRDCLSGPDGHATCIQKMDGVVWPGGYCSSTCRMDRNDPETGINRDCPGGSGSCYLDGADGGNQGVCLLNCTFNHNCEFDRYQYECHPVPERRYQLVCRPTSYHKCDGRKLGSCGPGVTCVTYSSDILLFETRCQRSCDLLTPPEGCNCQRNRLGEGFCTIPETMRDRLFKPGERCVTDLEYPCSSGHGCVRGFGPEYIYCRPYCTKESERARCGPCGECVDIRNGIGICSS